MSIPSSAFIKNDSSSWELISQGAEARVWKVPIIDDDDDGRQQQQPASSQATAAAAAAVAEAPPPPMKRTRVENDKVLGKQQEEGDAKQQLLPQKWMVAKERFQKSYRHPQLDERLTKQRCRIEARILEKCRRKAVIMDDKDNDNESSSSSNNSPAPILRVPSVHRIEPPTLFLEFLPGKTVRDALEEEILPAANMRVGKEGDHDDDSDNNATAEENSILVHLSQRIGRMIGQLHSLGIVHGDLTTSNMMLVPPAKTTGGKSTRNSNDSTATPSQSPTNEKHADGNIELELALIDFGLAKNTESAEERAVDLYVLERALISTHPRLPPSFIKDLLSAYSEFGSSKNKDSKNESSSSNKSVAATLRRLDQVRQRGRKRECFG